MSLLKRPDQPFPSTLISPCQCMKSEKDTRDTHVNDILIIPRVLVTLSLAPWIGMFQNITNIGCTRNRLPSKCNIHNSRIDSRLPHLYHLNQLLTPRSIRWEYVQDSPQIISEVHKKIPMRVLPSRCLAVEYPCVAPAPQQTLVELVIPFWIV